MGYVSGDSQASGILGNVSVLRIMRVVRIVRVAKIIRVMRFFRELRLMIFSILGCMKSLVWAMLVLWALFFMFGIHMTTGVVEYYTSAEFERNEESILHEDLLRYFGNLEASVMSLFRSMSGGDDWGNYYDALSILSWPYPASFLIFIC